MVFVAILYIFSRSDLIHYMKDNLDLTTQSNLYLTEAYNLTEKKIKRAELASKLYWFYFTWLH